MFVDIVNDRKITWSLYVYIDKKQFNVKSCSVQVHDMALTRLTPVVEQN